MEELSNQGSCTILHSYQQWWRVLVSPYLHQHLMYVILIKTSAAGVSGGISWYLTVPWYLIVVSVCISLMPNNVKHLFIYLLAVCISSLRRMTIQILCPLFNWVNCFLLLSCKVFFLYSRFKYFIRYMICKCYNCHPLCCFFTFLIVFLEAQKFYILTKSTLFIFILVACAFDDVKRNYWIIQCYKDLCLCFHLCYWLSWASF